MRSPSPSSARRASAVERRRQLQQQLHHRRLAADTSTATFRLRNLERARRAHDFGRSCQNLKVERRGKNIFDKQYFTQLQRQQLGHVRRRPAHILGAGQRRVPDRPRPTSGRLAPTLMLVTNLCHGMIPVAGAAPACATALSDLQHLPANGHRHQQHRHQPEGKTQTAAMGDKPDHRRARRESPRNPAW